MGPGFPRLAGTPRRLRRGDPSSGPGTTPLRLRQSGDRPRLARELEDVQPGVGAVDHVDEAAFVGLDVVALDRGLAAVLAVDLDAARIGLLGDRRDEEADLLRPVGIAHVERANAGVEEGDERQLLVEYRGRAFVGRMRAEAAAALAEMAARLVDRKIGRA